MSSVSKKQKRLLIFVGALLFLILIFYIFLNYWANYRLPAMLGDKVESKNIDVSIIGSWMKFDQPSVVLNSNENESGLGLEASAKSMVIDGFGIWDLLIGDEIDVDDFIVDSLSVSIQLPEKESSGSQKELNLFVKDIFNQIKVNHLKITNSGFLVRKLKNGDTLYDVRKFNLSADGIVIDTATEQNPFPLDFDQSKMTTASVSLRLGENYILSGENLLIEDTIFSAENIRLEPRFSKSEWVKKHKYEKARVDVSTDFLKMNRLIWNLKGDNPLKVTSPKAQFEQLQILVFKDKDPPLEPEHVKPLLTTLIQELPIVLTIDTVVFKNAYIEYEQRPVEHPRAGVVSFETLYMTGYNLTNDTARIRKNPVTTLDVVCQFMGEGELSTIIKLLMNSDDGEFEVSGKLGQMPLTYVNQVLAPLAGAEAEGQVNEITFDFTGDNFKSEGKLDFYYEDLEVTMVDEQRDKQWLKSLLGNVALRNNNSREQSEDDQRGEIYFVRYQNKGFWNFLWNSVQTGLVDVVVPFYSHPDKDRTRSDDPKYKEDD